MQCNDECCENRHGKRKRRPNRISTAKDMRENFGKLHRLIEEVKKLSKNNVSDSLNERKTNRAGEKAENVIENIETNLNKLGVGFKKKNQPKRHNHFNKLHETTEKTNEHFSVTINQTENSKLSPFHEKEGGVYDQKKINTHDMIDDDQEPSNSDESAIKPKNDSSITEIISEDHLEENGKKSRVNGTDPVDQLENGSLGNDEDNIPHSQEISMREDDEETVGDGSHSINEPADGNTEPVDISSEPEDDISETGNEDEKGEKPAGDASHSIKEPADSNTEPVDISSEPEDDISETVYEDENGDENERLEDDFSLKDSKKDPSDELLDEEGIDDLGKYGKKRNMLPRKN